MADIVNSLFFSPRDYQAQKDKQFQESLGNYLDANGNFNPNKAGFMMGANIGRKLGEGALGLFGIQDPELVRAKKLEEILQTTQQELGDGINDPTLLYPAIQKKLAEGGFSKEAFLVGQEGSKLGIEYNLNKAKITNEDAHTAKYRAEAVKALRENNPSVALFYKLAEKSTPQSVKAALDAGGDISLLDTPEKQKYSDLAQKLIDAGLQYGTPEFNKKMMEFLTADFAGKSKGTGNVSVNMGGISIDAKKVSEEAGKVTGKDAASIEEQYSQLDDFNKAKEMLKNGIFAGQYGPTEMKIAKTTRQNLGKVANTEKFKAFIAQNVIKRLKDIGGNDTQEERDYLERMVGGDISAEPETIKAIIESGEAKIRNKITRTQMQVDSASKGKPIPLQPILKEGIVGKSKSGKPMIVKNGKWEYQ